jgi:hypothetical protein
MGYCWRIGGLAGSEEAGSSEAGLVVVGRVVVAPWAPWLLGCGGFDGPAWLLGRGGHGGFDGRHGMIVELA